MDQGQGKFGVSNLEYDVVTTMSNLLQGLEVLEKYATDAEQAGEQECATIFRTIRDNNRNSVQQLRNVLARQLGKG